jgi:hypothetical protein
MLPKYYGATAQHYTSVTFLVFNEAKGKKRTQIIISPFISRHKEQKCCDVLTLLTVRHVKAASVV